MNSGTSAPMRFPLPILIFGASVILSVIARTFVPLPWIGKPLADLVMMFGLITIIGGVWIVGAAAFAMRSAETTVRPDRPATHFLTKGPFRFSRNPIYLGMAMILFGIGAAAGDLWSFLFALLACIALQRFAILPEERHLESRFGKLYRDYCKKVRRWI